MLPESAGTVTGKLKFVDNAVDAASGTVRVKAEFANKDERLWPGAFVTIRLAVQTLAGASVIPQAAIIQSPRGKIVYVVDASAKAAARPVEIVYASGEEVAVTGVKPGERIVLDGRQNLRPGATVIDRPAGDAAARPARRRGVGRGERRLGGVGGDARGRARRGDDGDAAGAGRLATRLRAGSRP